MPSKEEWLNDFKARLARVGEGEPGTSGTAVSIKIGVESGCFHREHSPVAYSILEQTLGHGLGSSRSLRVEEHESGPEVIAYLALSAAGLSFAKSVIDLVVTIIKSRSEGAKRGDHPSSPLVLTIRGTKGNGDYFEEKLLRVEINAPVDASKVEKLLNSAVQRHLGND